MKIKNKWLLIAADFLEQASDEFSNHGCNDWDFPDDWTEKEKQEFVKKMYEDNGDPENYNPNHLDMPNWWVMGFLAGKIRDVVKCNRSIN